MVDISGGTACMLQMIKGILGWPGHLLELMLCQHIAAFVSISLRLLILIAFIAMVMALRVPISLQLSTLIVFVAMITVSRVPISLRLKVPDGWAMLVIVVRVPILLRLMTIAYVAAAAFVIHFAHSHVVIARSNA